MKKIASIFIIGFFCFSSVTYAQEVYNDLKPKSEYKASELVIVEEGDVIEKDFFGSGEVVEIAGVVNGDVYAVGERIDISGTVNGDVLVAGGMVNISGTVTDDVRTAGGQINISGTVGRNITAIGGNVVVSNDATVDGSLVIVAGNATINTLVKKDVTAVSGNVSFGNIVQGDATVASGQFIMHPNAQVNGELVKIDLPSEGDRKKNAEIDLAGRGTSNAQVFLFFECIQFIAALTFGLMLLHIFPKGMILSAKYVVKKTFKSFILGIIACITAPILAGILIITLIGLPVGMLLLASFFLSMYVGHIFVAFALGMELRKKLEQKWHDGWALALGLAIFSLLKLIPVMGWILWILIMWLGMGALLLALKEVYKGVRDAKIA